MRWFDELLYSDRSSLGYIQRFRVDKVLKEIKTKRQHLLIFETPYFGRVLVIDGVVQTTEKDEFAYHEMLSHVPILAHGKVISVLIIGGGDGGVLKQVLRHRGVTSVTVVEIDETVSELCEEYLPLISEGAFKNPRTNLVVDDDMDGAAGAITFHLRKIERLGDDALTGEGRLAVDQYRDHPRALLVVQIGLFGVDDALDDGIHELEVAGLQRAPAEAVQYNHNKILFKFLFV